MCKQSDYYSKGRKEYERKLRRVFASPSPPKMHVNENRLESM